MPGNRIRVLHVDDHADYVSMPASQLEQVDDRLVVDVVDTVADARDALRDGDVDCVVTEYHLVTDAEQPVDRIRSEDESVPVVLFTEADLQTVAPALEDGPTEYVAKGGASNETTYSLLAERIVRLVETSRPDPGTEQSLQDATMAVGDGLDVPACVIVDGDTTSVNDAFTARFDVNEAPPGVDDLARVAGADQADLASFLRHPRADRFTFADADGRQVVVRAATEKGSDAVATLWVDGGNEASSPGASVLDSLLSAAPFGIAVKDAEGRYVSASDSLPQFHPDGRLVNPEGKVHHAGADVRGKTDYDLYSADYANRAVEADERIVETGEPVVRANERYVTPSGAEMALSTTRLPWYDEDGAIRGVVVLCEDVTDEREETATAARQTARLRDVERAVTAGLADRLADASDALAMGIDDPDADRLASAQRTLESVADAVDAVRQIARYGQPPDELEPVEVGAAAEDVWADLDAPDASLTVASTTVADTDQVRLRELFEQVFANALEHGGSTVDIRVDDLPDGFYVEDDGPGADAEEYDRLLDAGYASTDDATGMGLAVVIAIAESFGWEVDVAEASTGGLRLEFTLGSRSV